MAEYNPRYVYHLHIYSQCMPSFKGFFDTRRGALSFFLDYLFEHFPSKELKLLEQDDIDKLLDNCARLLRVDRKTCKDYEKLYTTGSKPRVLKFFRMITKKEQDDDTISSP